MKKHIRENLEKFLRNLGYRLVPLWRMRNLELTDHLATLFRKLEVDCVLDVGANRGQFRDLLRNEAGYEGLIVSFEPVAANVEVLRERARKDDLWKIYGLALGSTDGMLPINIMKQDMFSSLLAPETEENLQQFKEFNSVARVEEVEVRRLDGLFDEIVRKHDVKRIYLKLDTQGYDLEVVKGAGGVLSRLAGMQTEVAVQRLYKGMPSYQESIRILTDLGFEITGMFPVTRDKWLRVVEFDCTLINRSMISIT